MIRALLILTILLILPVPAHCPDPVVYATPPPYDATFSDRLRPFEGYREIRRVRGLINKYDIKY